jgi:hypothetical protein
MVAAFGRAQALVEAEVPGALSPGASVAAEALAEATGTADFTLPGETVPVSQAELLGTYTGERRSSTCLVLMEQVPWVPVP